MLLSKNYVMTSSMGGDNISSNQTSNDHFIEQQSYVILCVPSRLFITNSLTTISDVLSNCYDIPFNN